VSRPIDQVEPIERADSGWRSLYKIGGVAALLAAIVFRRNWAAEVWLLRNTGVISSGPTENPIRAIDWFALLQAQPFLGLILLDVVDIINIALVGLIYFALYGALRRVSKSWMALATALGFVGMAVYFASNKAFAMLTLSHRYAAATSDAQRGMFLAAGEALLAINYPGAPYQGAGHYLSLFLVTLAGFIISMVMLRSSVFGKGTAWLGIVAHSLGLLFFVALALAPLMPSLAPAMLAIPPSLSAPFLLVWYILIALRLFRL
jgi:hypothetical protein